MGVVLRQRKNSDGTISLRLDISYNSNRVIETLPYKLFKAITPADREINKSILIQAKKAATDRANDLDKQGYIAPIVQRKVPVAQWMQAYCNEYQLKDKRNMQGVTKRFVTFLSEQGKQNLSFGNLTEDIVQDFWEYLTETCTGEGDSSYFRRFKKMMKSAYKAKMMASNVAAEVKAEGGGKAKKKDIITISEIQTLAKTPIENQETKNAFLFSCFTGLRWCDIKQLKWENIDLSASSMTVLQAKTKVVITVPLSDTAKSLLGEKGQPQTSVFKLTSANGANKTLKAWVTRAGIQKSITWHNARHSFGTNLILKKTDVVTTSKLLGHTSLKHTQRYVDSADQLKRKAVQGLKIRL